MRASRPRAFFTRSWTWCGEALGSVVVRTEADAVIFTSCSSASGESKSLGQRVPLVWTRCHLGGARPWFRCSASVGGRPCGRRAARLYLRGHVFACRQCCGLAYASQSENPRYRAISKSQKLRMRLGGGPSILDPFAEKPPRMHWQTYYRWLHKAMAAQERSIALEVDDMSRRYPGLLSQENVAES